MIQKLSDIEGQPIVGQYYKVPCVNVGKHYMTTRIAAVIERHLQQGSWRPILEPLHDDADIIAVPRKHYHYDLRFISERQLRQISYRGLSSAFFAVAWDGVIQGSPSPMWLRRKCLRVQPTYPRDVQATWFPLLQQVFEDRKLPDSMRCPHQGISLKGMPIVDGRVTCPGHGLCFDVNTRELVRI